MVALIDRWGRRNRGATAGSLFGVTAPTPYSPHPDGTMIEVWAVPGASRTRIAGWHDGALRVQIAAPPQDGKANRVLLDLLRRTTGARRAQLVSGASARRKRVVVEGITPREAARLLAK